MTKLRKNDYIDFRKGGIKAIDVKILELLADYSKTMMLKMKNELKNLREPGMTRRAIATLKTIKSELKETK
jgi:ribosomal protein L29